MATALALVIVALSCVGQPPEVREREVPFAADGSLDYTDAGLGLSLVAEPGTFVEGALKVREDRSAAPIPETTLAAPAIALTTSGVPNRPVRVSLTPYRPVDEGLVVAMLEHANGKIESVPFSAEGGRLVAEVPHFSILRFVLFDSAEALGKWLSKTTSDFWRDYSGSPIQCASGNKTPHLTLSRFDGGAILDVEATDGGSPTRVRLALCNQRQFYMDYVVDGAAVANGLLRPRSSIGIELSVQGSRGAPLTVRASYGVAAQLITAVTILLSIVPGGDVVVGASTPVRLLALAQSLNCFNSAGDLIEMLICARKDPAVAKVLGEFAWNVLRQQGRVVFVGLAAFIKKASAIYTLLESGALVERLLIDWQIKPRDVSVAFALACPPAGVADTAKTWIETVVLLDGRLRSTMHIRDANGVPTTKIPAPQQAVLFKAVRPPFATGDWRQTPPSKTDTVRLETGGAVAKESKMTFVTPSGETVDVKTPAIWVTPSAPDVVAITTPGAPGAPEIAGWIIDLGELGRPITGVAAPPFPGCHE